MCFIIFHCEWKSNSEYQSNQSILTRQTLQIVTNVVPNSIVLPSKGSPLVNKMFNMNFLFCASEINEQQCHLL